MLETPGIDFISLLLTGGGWRTNFGGLVRHTGSPAALMRIPVIPAKAGLTGLDPFKFFTGTVGTLGWGSLPWAPDGACRV